MKIIWLIGKCFLVHYARNKLEYPSNENSGSPRVNLVKEILLISKSMAEKFFIENSNRNDR